MVDCLQEVTFELTPIEVTFEVEDIEVIFSPLGEKGEKGDDGAAGATLALTKMADGTLSGHRIVRSTGLDTVSYADATDISNADDVLGLITQAASDGDSITVIVEGDVVEPSWSWAALDAIYLTGLGMLTQTPPDSPDVFSLCVGYATAATSMRVRIGMPIAL